MWRIKSATLGGRRGHFISSYAATRRACASNRATSAGSFEFHSWSTSARARNSSASLSIRMRVASITRSPHLSFRTRHKNRITKEPGSQFVFTSERGSPFTTAISQTMSDKLFVVFLMRVQHVRTAAVRPVYVSAELHHQKGFLHVRLLPQAKGDQQRA